MIGLRHPAWRAIRAAVALFLLIETAKEMGYLHHGYSRTANDGTFLMNIPARLADLGGETQARLPAYSAPSSPAGLRVLYLGPNWYGSCARACSASLRRLGCDVHVIDPQTVFPQLRRLTSRVLLRLFSNALANEYNELILDAATWFRPDMLLAFKGIYVKSLTLRALTQRGIPTYNYYPDENPFAHDALSAESLFAYDCVFYTKRYWEKEPFITRFKNRLFIPHGYDPEIHKPHSIRSDEFAEYGRDVAVVGSYSPYKEQVLDNLLSLMPSLDLAIWGRGWNESCRSRRVLSFVRGYAINGAAYAKVLSTVRINLALMSRPIRRGVRRHDETSTRTYEIPACGGFMLHERSGELQGIFEEDKEVVCFDCPVELAQKIEHYLAHPSERDSVARAGYLRCVPAYSYDARVSQILSWHIQRSPFRDSSPVVQSASVNDDAFCGPR